MSEMSEWGVTSASCSSLVTANLFINFLGTTNFAIFMNTLNRVPARTTVNCLILRGNKPFIPFMTSLDSELVSMLRIAGFD